MSDGVPFASCDSDGFLIGPSAPSDHPQRPSARLDLRCLDSKQNRRFRLGLDVSSSSSSSRRVGE